ncbi:hypothetical protein P7C70_g7657, partial [Phenoliferia sp. Uapishka_3]
MATVQALAPMMAQQFCESRSTTTSGVAFDMIASSSPTSRRRDQHHPASPKGANDIFSLTDAVLAERYQFVEEIGYGNWVRMAANRERITTDAGCGGSPAGERLDVSPQDVLNARAQDCSQACSPIKEPNLFCSRSQPLDRIQVSSRSRASSQASPTHLVPYLLSARCIRALRDLTHPNIIDFHSFIITPSYALISMAHHPRLMPVELPESKARSYFRQLISAVDFLHSNGCTHNDLKPANILLSREDNPVLVDFGFAQQYDLGHKDRFLSSLSWGTPEYLSPERAKGILHDERLSDNWALGLYEIVVGRTPFEKTESEEFLTRDALEVYYHRTTSGSFCGDYKISAGAKSIQELDPHHGSAKRESSAPDVWARSSTRLLRRSATASPFSVVAMQVSSFPFVAVANLEFSSALMKSIETKPSATPPRSAGGTTPSSSANKGASFRKPVGGKAPIKIYQDADSPTPSRVHPPISPASRILVDRNDRKNPLTPATKQTPSKIPVRKVDISSPVVLVKKSTTPHKTSAPTTTSRKSSPTSGRKSTTPTRKSNIGATSTPPPLPTTYSPSLPARNSPQSPPPFSALAPSSLARPVAPPKASVRKVAARSSPPAKTITSSSSKKGEEDLEVLSDRKGGNGSLKRSQGFASFSGFQSSSSQSSPSSSFFSKSSVMTPMTDRFDDFTSLSFEDTTSTGFSAFAMNQTQPIPHIKSSTSLASKLRKLSLRRAPSALSFRGIKSSISHRALRRPSSSESLFSMIEAAPINKEDKSSVTMPLSFGREAKKAAANANHNDERERLETFSRHIQHIIDARKQTDPPFLKRSIAPKAPSNQNTANFETAILSPSEVQEFRQQVAQELEEDRRKKASLSDEEKPSGPRARRSSTLSRVTGTPLPHVEPFAVKIRPSLAPSFIRSCPPPGSPPERLPLSSSSTCSSYSVLSADSGCEDNTATFKPGHRRIPTNIRSVPSILLTESADDESESEYARSETPGSVYSERVASPPPEPRIVEEARQLPIWVPDDLSSDDEDADVDEPTIKIDVISTPTKLRRTPVAASPKAKASMASMPSSTGLFNQFVAATPGVSRRVRMVPTPTEPTPLEFNVDPRSASRATTNTTDSRLSRKHSVISFFFKTDSRPVTPSPSMASMSSVSVGDLSEANDGAQKRGGRFKRGLKKLFK